MKCQEYDPDEYGCMSILVFGRCPLVPEKQCHGGWITFWTPAERAGLKALGEGLDMQSDPEECAVGMIRAYVQAARKSKERR
jgi:hypothetical protein